MGKFLPQERAKAKSLGEKTYFTGKPCKYGHIELRATSNGACIVCQSIKHKEWKAKNKDLMQESYKKSYKKHSKKRCEKAKEYREKHSDLVKKAQKKYWANNLDVARYNTKKRQAIKLKAMPSWLNNDNIQQIKKYYKVAKNLQKESGIKMAVDHIIPLQGDNVCGLHVPWNLIVISASENSKKRNKLIEFPWCHSNNGVMIGGNALPWNWS